MKYCVIIDDTDQQSEIELLKVKAKEKGVALDCEFFHIDLSDYKYQEESTAGPEFFIDFEKVHEALEKKFLGKELHLVACDYDFKDKRLNGLKLIQKLKEKSWRGKKIPYILYSADDKEIKSELKEKVSELIGNDEDLIAFLQDYYKKYPSKITGRPKYDEEIISFLQTNKVSLELKLSDRLLIYPDMEFKAIYNRFAGKKLKELSKILLAEGNDGDAFENEFLDRSIAHFIELKE